MSDRKPGTITGGESPNGRRAIDRMVGQMVKAGNDPKYAKRIAREQAIKADRKKRG